MNITRSDANAANTLTEVLITVLLVGIFFASIFELNAVCLRYISASKQSVAAIAAVQDRAEVLRNLAFSDLTTTVVRPEFACDCCRRFRVRQKHDRGGSVIGISDCEWGDTTDAQHRRECDLEFHRDQPWHHTCEIGYLTSWTAVLMDAAAASKVPPLFPTDHRNETTLRETRIRLHACGDDDGARDRRHDVWPRF